jgi:hypothetical protein
MFKAAIIVCAICAAGTGTTLWLEAGGKATPETVGAASAEAMPSIQELHAKSRMDHLPVQAGLEPF